MIELNDKTKHDFLSREWVQKLLDAGVDMSDAKYGIVRSPFKDGADSVILIEHAESNWLWIPTYTISELLYKLHEWIYPTIDGVKYSGGLKMIKDAPFYIAWYDLKDKFTETGESKGNYIYAGFEYPIESLASLLVQCHQKDIGMEMKDTGNISDK